MKKQLGFSRECLIECLEEDMGHDKDYIEKHGENHLVSQFNIKEREKAIRALRKSIGSERITQIFKDNMFAKIKNMKLKNIFLDT